MKFIFASVMALANATDVVQKDYKCADDTSNCRSDLVCSGPMVNTVSSAEQHLCVKWDVCNGKAEYKPESNFNDADVTD